MTDLTANIPWPLILAALLGLLALGYMLVRYGLVDRRDAIAGGVLVGALLYVWTKLRGRFGARRKTPGGSSDDAPDTGEAVESVDRVMDDTAQQLADPPPDDVHDQLHEALRHED